MGIVLLVMCVFYMVYLELGLSAVFWICRNWLFVMYLYIYIYWSHAENKGVFVYMLKVKIHNKLHIHKCLLMLQEL